MGILVKQFQRFEARRSTVGLAVVALVLLAGLAVTLVLLTSSDSEVSTSESTSDTEPEVVEALGTTPFDTKPGTETETDSDSDSDEDAGQALAQTGSVGTDDTGNVPEPTGDTPDSQASTPAKPVETPPSSPPPTTAAPTPAPSGGPSPDAWAKLRDCEASGRYDAVNPAGPYYGAYQFNQATWNSVASSSGRNDLVGVVPSEASPADQDAMALALYNDRGAQPWPTCGRFLR